MPDYLPTYKAGKTITLIASTAITGGQLVQVGTDGRIAPAALNSLAFVGVAGHDATTGEPVTIHCGGVQELSTSGAVAAGDRVITDNNGAVKSSATPATGALVGVAITASSAGRARIQMER